MSCRSFFLAGVLLLVSLQAFPNGEPPTSATWNSVIGLEFDSTKVSLQQELSRECEVIENFEQPLSGHCIEELTEHFSKEPVWALSRFYYLMFGTFTSESSRLNNRYLQLKFSPSDIAGDTPKWRDIFDGQEKERVQNVRIVLEDEECAQLVNRGKIQINSNLSQRCQSRNLVKYAIYLDACMTAVNRINNLLFLRATDGQNDYEYVTAVWRLRFPTRESEIGKAKLDEILMHSIWLRNICKHVPLDGFDEAFGGFGWNPSGISVLDMTKALQDTHDEAMAIAARSGDPWAIQGFWARDIRGDLEYWQSLYGINPLLFHRWISKVGGTLGLSDAERAMHLITAYSLEKEQLKDHPDFDSYISGHSFGSDSDREIVESLIENPLPENHWMKIFSDNGRDKF